jgi:NAD-dependent deacetylase
MTAQDEGLASLIGRPGELTGPVVFLTGAGVSAESGVSTLRGEEDHWPVGSRRYHPVELATWMAFQRMPAEIWGWYLYRRARCLNAEPNPAHRAIAALERRLGDRFLLVTENVDGLHRRAGSARTYEIHGNLDYARCAAECHSEVRALPADFGTSWQWRRRPDEEERRVLTCDRCDGWLRPNVLWFDEPYDEDRFRSDSALTAACGASLLVAVGATGASILPTKMCHSALARGAVLVVVDPDPTPLSQMAESTPQGRALRGPASKLVPRICGAIA